MNTAPRRVTQGQIQLGSITRYTPELGTCDLSMRTDLMNPDRSNVPITMPYLGRGWGIMAGIEERSNVLIGEQYGTGPVVLGYTPVEGYLQSSIDDVKDADLVYENVYRMPLVGEIVLQSKADSYIYLNQWGDIRLTVDDDTYVALDRVNNAYMRRIDQVYCKNHSMLSVSGKIKRDLDDRLVRDRGPGSALYHRHLANSYHHLYEVSLATVADDPMRNYFPYEIENSQGTNETQERRPPATSRNPALAETRMRFYEYADEEMHYLIQNDKDNNHEWRSVDDYLQINYGADYVFRSRAQASTEIVKNKENLNILATPKRQTCLGQNVLGEMILGTIVESDGHIFDIENEDITKKHSLFGAESNFNTETLHNKGRVVHFELNSKQFEIPEGSNDFEVVNKTKIGGSPYHNHWRLDIDKEGRTSVHIPAATHIKDYLRSDLFDLRHIDLSGIGWPNSFTGMHGKAPRGAYSGGEGTSPKGISLNLRLDGSLEANIGKDAYDSKSISLNTAGMVTAWLGSDAPSDDDGASEIHSGVRHNRSLVLQTDGSIEGSIGKDENANRSIDLELKGGVCLEINNADENDRANPGVSIHSVGKWHQKIDGNTTLNIGGNYVVTALNSYNVRAIGGDGAYNVSASKSVYIKSQLDCYLSAGQTMIVQGGMKPGGKIVMLADEIIMTASNIRFVATKTITSVAVGIHVLKGSPLLLIPI